MSQEDEVTSVHEDDVSLSIVELPPEFHYSDSVTMDVVHSHYKNDLDLDRCLPRCVLTTFLNRQVT